MSAHTSLPSAREISTSAASATWAGVTARARAAVRFCSRFLFFFCHLTPEATHAAARQLVTALLLALELLRLLALWAPEVDATLPPRLAEQARACLGAFGLPLPGEELAGLRTLH